MRIMKKVIFALAAVVALAACSKEQTVSFDKGAAIGFDTFVDNATRVDPSLTKETMKNVGFGVYGFVTNSGVTAPLFTNEEIYWTDDKGWTYDVKQYWIDGATYDFAAIAPYGEYDVTAAGRNGVTLGFENDGITDLLYAQNNEAPHTTVGFTFKHLLSKVKFTFENKYDATNTVIAVKGINITNAYSEGTAELSRDTNGVTAVWTPTDATNTRNLAFGDAVNAGNYIAQTESASSANSLLLIPTASTTYNVEFTIELLYQTGVDGNDNPVYEKLTGYAHSVSLTHDFEFGKSYNVATTIDYTNIVPDDPTTPEDDKQKTIEFTVDAINEWVDGDDAGVVFPENN